MRQKFHFLKVEIQTLVARRIYTGVFRFLNLHNKFIIMFKEYILVYIQFISFKKNFIFEIEKKMLNKILKKTIFKKKKFLMVFQS